MSDLFSMPEFSALVTALGKALPDPSGWYELTLTFSKRDGTVWFDGISLVQR